MNKQILENRLYVINAILDEYRKDNGGKLNLMDQHVRRLMAEKQGIESKLARM